MKLLTILCTLLLSASALAQEDRIEVLGFHPDMSEGEFRTNCESRGFFFFDTTDDDDENYIAHYVCNSINEYPNILQHRLIAFYKQKNRTNSLDEIFIDCFFTGSCNATNSQIETELINKSIVISCVNLPGLSRCFPYQSQSFDLDTNRSPYWLEVREYSSLPNLIHLFKYNPPIMNFR